MQSTSHAFKDNVKKALSDDQLRKALGNMKAGFQDKRAATVAKLPEFQDLRDQGKAIKDDVLANLDYYLERFEDNVTKDGGQVHWARTSQEACDAILGICRDSGARIATKGKSMIAEEIGLNDYLEKNGMTPVETDLGEYIIQLRHEGPSHIIAPAIHLSKDQITDTFRRSHTHLDADRPLDEPRELTDEARTVLRQQFLNADVGITGANFLIAETGSTVIVTNEGNGDLTQNLPRVHIVIASIEKIVPTLEDASSILRLLARSATGQEYSVYTTFSSGPKRPDDIDGPDEFHVVILDNGRSDMLGTEAAEALRCIRCGACMNHCPVYGAIGGHAYGWVVPGPIGAALTPGLLGVEETRDLPNASTFCGKCEEVCPMKIPLPKIMHSWRVEEFDRGLTPPRQRFGLGSWAWVATRPRLYRWLTGLAVRAGNTIGRRRGSWRWMPFASGWTAHRDFPVPSGAGTFQQLYAQRQKNNRAGSGK